MKLPIVVLLVVWAGARIAFGAERVDSAVRHTYPQRATEYPGSLGFSVTYHLGGQTGTDRPTGVYLVGDYAWFSYYTHQTFAGIGLVGRRDCVGIGVSAYRTQLDFGNHDAFFQPQPRSVVLYGIKSITTASPDLFFGHRFIDRPRLKFEAGADIQPFRNRALLLADRRTVLRLSFHF